MVTPVHFSSSVETYLDRVQIPLRLACANQEGWPRVLSLWFYYEGGKLYCATRATAHVVGWLENEPRCAFEIASDQPPYCGIRGKALATIDRGLGGEVLERLITRYLGKADVPLARWLLKRKQAEVAIILKPISLHAWNYSERMEASVTHITHKPCP